MAISPISSIERYQAKLQKRLDRLLLDLAGSPVERDEMRMHGIEHDSRRVNAEDIREAVDEFMITLKEIKTRFGKR